MLNIWQPSYAHMKSIIPRLKRLVSLLSLCACMIWGMVYTPVLGKLGLWLLNKTPITINPVAADAHLAVQSDTSYTMVPVDRPVEPVPAIPHTVTTVRTTSQSDKNQHAPSNPLTAPVIDTPMLQIGSTEWLAWRTSLSMLNAVPEYAAPRLEQNTHKAQVIVVLGGGLGRDYLNRIVANRYTTLRLAQAILVHEKTGLPILLSGVEAPWMQNWLIDKGVQANWLEPNSMNTCENARFSTLMLQKYGGATHIDLITDAYHMPRARRLFAQNGVITTPVVAAMPGDPAPWWPDARNKEHSRRAIHELLALARDIGFGDTSCREVP